MWFWRHWYRNFAVMLLLSSAVVIFIQLMEAFGMM